MNYEELAEVLADELAKVDGAEIVDAQFSDLTTLHVGGRPLLAVACTKVSAAAKVVELLDARSQELIIVGGGSNLLVTDEDLPQVAVILQFDDIEAHPDTGLLVAEAGAVWDDVVALSVDLNLGGIECLSGIPGSAGATPVQNVGAYGAEIADVLTRVLLYDRSTGVTEWHDASTLELGYRHSNLKFTSRAVVLAVELQLQTDGLSAPLRYGELARALGAEGGARMPVLQVREEVLRLRRSKGMVFDPEDVDTWSAGSFFTNPIVPNAQAAELGDDMPKYPAGDASTKLSAAWLIDHAGFHKGFPGAGAPARLSTKHTLALTNRGQATAQDIVELARVVRDGVHAHFGVELVPEPVWVGVELPPLSPTH